MTRGVDPPEVEGYQWDGWKLIMIAKLNTDGSFHSRKWSCVWRPDVGSSLYARSDWMRAGGVGGVAWLQTGAVQSYSYGTGGAEVHLPLADHMGNVRHYYQFKATKGKVIGQLVASYEYDAFGREVRAWGLNTPTENQSPGLPASRPWADLLPFHYSSKLRDVDSGFNYYGYRFYDPGAGRWLNRDPIEEEGGVNLYGMVGNDAVNRVDVLGLEVEKRDCNWVICLGHGSMKSDWGCQCHADWNILKQRYFELPSGDMIGFVGCHRSSMNGTLERLWPGRVLPSADRKCNLKMWYDTKDADNRTKDQPNCWSGLYKLWHSTIKDAENECKGKSNCCTKITIKVVCTDSYLKKAFSRSNVMEPRCGSFKVVECVR